MSDPRLIPANGRVAAQLGVATLCLGGWAKPIPCHQRCKPWPHPLALVHSVLGCHLLGGGIDHFGDTSRHLVRAGIGPDHTRRNSWPTASQWVPMIWFRKGALVPR